MTADRAVSQSVGFILTFSVIIVSAGIVSTVGFDQLNQIRVGEQQENAERAMTLVHQNMAEIHRGESIRRSGEIDLNRGSLSMVRPGDSRMTVEVNGPNDDYRGEFTMAGVKYTLSDTSFVYEGGALFRSGPSGTTMVKGPSLVCQEDRAIVPVVTTESDGYRQVSAGTVTTHLRHNESTVRFPHNRTGENSSEGRSTVTIRIDSDYDAAWNRYLSSDENEWEATGTPNEYACDGPEPTSPGVQRYAVVQTRIDFSLVR